MKKHQQNALLGLRLVLGWLFLYAGYSKIMNPEWSAIGFLEDAKTFGVIYDWFASASNIGWVNFLNQWGQILIGVGLITGTFTTLAAYAGVLMMVLYYFPGLEFPYLGHSFIIDDHVIYAFGLLVLVYFRAGQYMGLDQRLAKKYKLKGWWF